MTVQLSNAKYLTVLPPASLEGVGWTVRVLSERDYASPIALVERFAGLGFTVEANAEGGGTVSLDSDDGIFSGALPAGETTRLQDQEALWQVLEDGQVRFEFLAEDVDEDIIPANGGPRQTVIAGRGTASVLEWAPVLPAGMPTPKSMAREFNAHPMAVWVQLFHEAQAAGFLGWVNLDFTADADSQGVAWGPAQALTVNAGETLLDLLKRWAEANELSWRMLPGFTLEVRKTPGVRLEDKVVFTQYRSQGQHRRKISRRQLANIVYADSGDTGLAYAEDSASAAKWRKRAAWVTAGDAADTSARSAVANTTLSLAKDQRLSRTLKLLPDRAGRHPFVDFNVHDWVGVEVPDDDTESGARQVLGLAVDIDQDGTVQYEATLQSRFEAREIKTRRMLDKLGASERSGSGAAAASPIPVSKALSTVNMADLSDVDLTAPAAGSLLQYSGGRWVDTVANLDLLADVDTAGANAPTAGQALVYDGTLGVWKPATPATPASTLDALTDVEAAAPAAGQVLTWDNAAQVWKPGTPAAGGGSGVGPAVLDPAPRAGSAPVVSTSANGTKGIQLACSADCRLTAVGVRWTTVAGRLYRLAVFQMSTTANLTLGAKLLEVDATPGAGTDQVYSFGGLALDLAAGNSYAFLISDTTNAALNIWVSAVAGWPSNRHFWTPRSASGNGGGVVRATGAPATGNTITAVAGEYAATITTTDR